MNNKEVKFTAKEQRFIEEYLLDLNATQAAIRAKYSKRSAAEIGYENLRKPHIKTEIEKRLKADHLDADGTISIVSKIAKSNANRYLKVVKVEHTPMVERHLLLLIADLKKKIAFESQYASLARLSEDEYASHLAVQTQRERKILRYELELNDNPDAFRMVPGDPVMVETTEFDLVALAKDKENGIIKSFKMTKDGPQVEFCSIDGNLANLLRVHGKFDDKLEVSEKGSISLNKWLSKNTASELNDADQKD